MRSMTGGKGARKRDKDLKGISLDEIYSRENPSDACGAISPNLGETMCSGRK